ncbi:MAG: glycerophosphodiester phosphodiesterase [Balneolaceae bacterium]
MTPHLWLLSPRFRDRLLLTLLMTLTIPTMTHAQSTSDHPQSSAHLPEFVAHRGASWLAPENTLASIQLAWQLHADGVEVDIYRTKDGKLALFHDRTTERTGGRDRAVIDQTLAELQELEVGSWKAEQWRGERVISLDEAISFVPTGKRMFIEIKTGTDTVEPMLEAFDRSGLFPHQLVVIAFEYEVAAKTKQLRPRTPVYWLSSFRQDAETGEWSPSMDELVGRAVEAGLDGLNLQFAGPATQASEVQKIRDSGLGYYIWTVNDPEAAELAIELGVDGITTDRPAWLRKQLLHRNGWKLMPKP